VRSGVPESAVIGTREPILHQFGRRDSFCGAPTDF
jgi:hypothetical protein